jgi:hypothetical protein
MDVTQIQREANRFAVRVVAVEPGETRFEVAYGKKERVLESDFFGPKTIPHPVSSRTYLVTAAKGREPAVKRKGDDAISAAEAAMVRGDLAAWLGTPVLPRMIPDRPIESGETLEIEADLARRFLGDLGAAGNELEVKRFTLTLGATRKQGSETLAVFAVTLQSSGTHEKDGTVVKSHAALKGEMTVAVETTRLVRFTAKGTLAMEGGKETPEGDASIRGSGPLTIRREIDRQEKRAGGGK